MFLDLNTIQLIQASAFQGIALSHLTILSSGLLKIPNITLLRKSLKYFRLVCGTNCYLNVESDHFQGSTRLCHVEIEKAGLTDISWRLSIRKQVRVISVAYNNNATLDSIYGIRFDKLSYLNLNHNFIITINIFYLDMPKLSELKIEETRYRIWTSLIATSMGVPSGSFCSATLWTAAPSGDGCTIALL